MVQLEEVEDDELDQAQPGPSKEDDDDFTDTGPSNPYPSAHSPNQFEQHSTDPPLQTRPYPQTTTSQPYRPLMTNPSPTGSSPFATCFPLRPVDALRPRPLP